MSWENFFNQYIGYKLQVKIAVIESESITWTSLTGFIDYLPKAEKLRFKSNEKGYNYEFDIIEVDPENNTFTSLNKSKFKIELNT